MCSLKIRRAAAGTGNAVADLLLGTANSFTAGTVAEAVERGWFGAGYFQDQWTVTPRFTLNLGVRYEYASPYMETQNRMANFISGSRGSVVRSAHPCRRFQAASIVGQGDKNNWAPRVGFAWRVPGMKEMVIRSSFGIFYAQDQGTGVTNRMTSNPPFFGYGAQTISSDQLFPTSGFVLNPGVRSRGRLLSIPRLSS